MKGAPTAMTIDSETKAQLEALAKSKGISVAELARQMLGQRAAAPANVSPFSIDDDFAEDMKRSLTQAMQIRMMASMGGMLGMGTQAGPTPPPQSTTRDLMEKMMEMKVMSNLAKGLSGDDEDSKKLMEAYTKSMMDDLNARLANVTKASEGTQNALKEFAEAQEKRAAAEKLATLQAKLEEKDREHAAELEALRAEIQNALATKEPPRDMVSEMSELADKYERIVQASQRLKAIPFGGNSGNPASGTQKSDLDRAKELISGINEMASSGVEIVSRVMNRGGGPGHSSAMAAGGVPKPNYPSPSEATQPPQVETITEDTLITDRDTGNQYTLRDWRAKFGSDPVIVDAAGRPISLPPAPQPVPVPAAPEPAPVREPAPPTPPPKREEPAPEPAEEKPAPAEPAPAAESEPAPETIES